MIINIVIFLISLCITTTSQLYSLASSATFSATQPVYAYSYPSSLITSPRHGAEARQQNNHIRFIVSTPSDDPIAQMRSMRSNRGYSYKKINYQNELAALEYMLAQQRHTPYLQKRCKAFDKTCNNSKRIKHTTMISHDVASFSQKYGIASRDLIHTKFNHYEYQLHKEFLEQLNVATELKHLYKQAPDYAVFIDAIGHGIALGVEANHNKQTVAATYWADVVWQTIDIAKAIGEGVGLGIYNTAAFGAQIVKSAGKAALHPIETVRAIARGINTVLSFFVPGFDRQKHRVNLYQELDALNERITQVAHHCSQQLSHMSLHDKVKFTSAFATEIVVPAKIFKVVHRLCKHMRPLAAGLLNSIREEQGVIEVAGIGKETILMHASEGMPLKCTDKTLLLEIHPPHCAGQYEALKSSLLIEQFTSIIKTTKHGIQRLIERGFIPEEVKVLLNNPDITRIQRDGAKVFIKFLGNNKYNCMIYNSIEEKVITALRLVEKKALVKLGNNHGWSF